MISGLGRHRDVTHVAQYATSGLFTSVEPFQRLRTERCTVPVIEVISTSLYELNKKLYIFFWLYRYWISAKISRKSIGDTAPDTPLQKYRRYRYCESIADEVSVSVPILILTNLHLIDRTWTHGDENLTKCLAKRRYTHFVAKNCCAATISAMTSG